MRQYLVVAPAEERQHLVAGLAVTPLRSVVEPAEWLAALVALAKPASSWLVGCLDLRH